MKTVSRLNLGDLRGKSIGDFVIAMNLHLFEEQLCKQKFSDRQKRKEKRECVKRIKTVKSENILKIRERKQIKLCFM